ncbi:MAG: DNA helicase RecQ [Spirosomaceae bacterium]|nr:DNA helicase RecQ [Spirosomataceae bacterium]
MTKEQALKKYFGYDKFRPLQSEIIDTILAKNDCMVLMPTGGGKSLCFQIPALLMDGLTVVISPLIALMKDQVQGLVANGISAAYINSTLTGSEQSSIEWKAKLGELKLLYISPEKLLSGNYLNFIKSLKVNLFAVDESHCVSIWGHDFRPEYTQLKALKANFPSVPIVALTATADKVTRKDILTQLGIPDAPTFTSSFDRPNLSLNVLPSRNRTRIIENFIKERPNQSGIIYCLSRNATEDVALALQRVGIRAAHYHAGLIAETREKVQDSFINDDLQVIVATIAFGMGIDKSNVRFIIHYNLPSNVESFYQEIGRAGRDGLKADTLLFYGYGDVIIRTKMITDSELPEEMKEVQTAKLTRLKQYAEADICRRRILLSYFNEEIREDCGNCDVCRNPRQRFDATTIAQKALSAIARTEEKVAMGMLIDILRGSQNRNVLERNYHQIRTFGAGRDLKGEEWAEYLTQMLNMGVMDIAYDDHHSFKLNNYSWSVLKGEQGVELVKFEPYDTKKARQDAENPKEKSKREVIRDALFEKLRLLRKQLADKLSIPPFLVFSDATISEMAQKKPISRYQMLQVSGVSDAKYKQFGEVFLNEVLDFIRDNNAKGVARVANGSTYIETLDLYKKGLSIEEIATRRNLQPSSIANHLIKLSEDGHDVDITKLISQQEYDAIVDMALELGMNKGDALKPLFEALNEEYGYDKIRLALAIWDKNG